MLDGTYFFECACGSPEHTIRFTLDKSDDPPMVFCDFYLDHYMPWWKRIYVAIKYILKRPPNNSHFDDWIMYAADVTRLRDMCEEFISTASLLPKP